MKAASGGATQGVSIPDGVEVTAHREGGDVVGEDRSGSQRAGEGRVCQLPLRVRLVR